MKKSLAVSLGCFAGVALVASAFSGPVCAQQTGGPLPSHPGAARRSVTVGEQAEGREREGPAAGDARSAPRPPASGRAPSELETLEQDCFNEVNHQRVARGLEPLEIAEELLPVARDYSRRMAEEGFFSHTDPDQRTVRERVRGAGVRWRVLGENLAFTRGYVNPVAACIRGWMESPGHRRNILQPAYQAGAVGAWIRRDGTIYFTEIFIRY